MNMRLRNLQKNEIISEVNQSRNISCTIELEVWS